jgi:hypothetical protein
LLFLSAVGPEIYPSQTYDYNALTSFALNSGKFAHQNTMGQADGGQGDMRQADGGQGDMRQAETSQNGMSDGDDEQDSTLT